MNNAVIPGGKMFSRFALIVHVLLIACVLAGAAPLSAEITLYGLISDNMVLQREQPVPITGLAAPGQAVALSFAGQKHSAEADSRGRWGVVLAPLAATRKGPGLEMRIESPNGDLLVIKNILVGDVWICTGASNMACPVMKTREAHEVIEAANFPSIRFFSVWGGPSEEPKSDCSGVWTQCNPGTVESFSAIGYSFGRRLHQELGVPIGLIRNGWGGTRAEAWTSRKSLEAEPSLRPMLDAWDQRVRQFDPAPGEAKYREQLGRWRQAAKAARAEGRLPPPQPRHPENVRFSRHRPAALFNGKMAPLAKMPICGIIWSQGKAHNPQFQQRGAVMTAMVRGLREAWRKPDLPVGIIDTTELGQTENVHELNYKEVGRRLADWALNEVYGEAKP